MKERHNRVYLGGNSCEVRAFMPVTQEKPPLDLSFFELVHNTRTRGKALLHSLVELLVS
jgi:hypothetical protein